MSVQAITQVFSGKLYFAFLPRINLRKVWIFGFMITITLLVSYIFQINEVTKESFLIYRHERDISAIFQQARDLEASLLAENSLSNMESLLDGLNYEKVSKVYYIQATDGQMAVRP